MITEIIPNLYLGSVWDSYGVKKDWALRICVAEIDNFSPEEQHDLLAQNKPILFLPFMVYEKPEADGINGPIPRWNSYADTEKLDKIGEVIECVWHLGWGDILVHCAAGVERSPLAVIWYLSHFYESNSDQSILDHLSLQEAYELVKLKRPAIENRLNWIKGYENE